MSFISGKSSRLYSLCLGLILLSRLPSLATSPDGALTLYPSNPMYPSNPISPSNPVSQPDPNPNMSSVARPAADLFYVDQGDDGSWSVVSPSDWEIKFNRSEFSGVYYYTVFYFDIRVHGVDVANVGDAGSYFFSPSQNAWWQAYSTYGTYYYTSVVDPTGGLVTPASPPFNTNPGSGDEHGDDYNEGYQEGHSSGYDQGFEQGIEEVLSDPEAYGLVSIRNIPSIKVAARRGTKLSISLTGNWNRYAASGVPSGWRFDRRSGILSGAMGRNETLTIRSSRGSASAAPIRIQLQSTAR